MRSCPSRRILCVGNLLIFDSGMVSSATGGEVIAIGNACAGGVDGDGSKTDTFLGSRIGAGEGKRRVAGERLGVGPFVVGHGATFFRQYGGDYRCAGCYLQLVILGAAVRTHPYLYGIEA